MAKVFQVDTGGTLTTGLTSYYKLEDATDFYGSNNATNVGSSTFTAGKVSNALTLNGTSQYLTATIPLHGLSAFSIWAWGKTNSNTTYQAIACQTDNVTKNVQLRLNTAGKFEFVLDTSSGAEITTAGTTVVSTGTYYFVVFTYDGSNAKLYVNGNTTPEATTAKTGTVDTGSNTTFGIGAYVTGGVQIPWNGQIDEMGVNTTKALSTTEITDLYNSGSGQTMITSAVASNNMFQGANF